MSKNILDIVVSEFMELTKIPRPSHYEERVAAYLYDWAVKRGLQVEKDNLGQIIIDKPASKGCEGKPLTIFQAHMDMVCVCEEGVQYDPVNDPIKVINDGKTLSAEGTSLGADDGIGVAMALYLLGDNDLRHGPIRAIFTVNEEDGMDSMNMDPKYLDGDYLVNLDWESIGSLCNSCAGGDFFAFSRKADWEAPAAGSKTMTIALRNLLGGHSGVGINKGHANALVSLATAMAALKKAGVGYQIADFSGGQAPNAIPKFGKVVFAIAPAAVDAAKAALDGFMAEFREAFGNIEPEYSFDVQVEDNPPKRVLSAKTSIDLIDLMTMCPNNVHTMSPFVDGLVESSSNVGTIAIDDEKITFADFARSSVAYHATQIGYICAAMAEHCGFDFTSDGHVPGWAVNPNSKLVPIACEAYKKLTGKEMIVEPVHAGVECGAFAEKNPRLDMIAIGPTLTDVHTPNESCCLEDVKVTTELLVEILSAIAG